MGETMRFVNPFAAIALAAAICTAPSLAAETVNDPDFITAFLLQQKYSHTTPSYEDVAQWDGAIARMDEFKRPDAIRDAAARLRAKAANLSGVKIAVVNLWNNFTEYDTQYGEYDFDINDGTYVSFSDLHGHEARIALTNGTKAAIWKLNTGDAAAVLRRNDGNRQVTLVLTLLLLPSPPAAPGEPFTLNAKVMRYDVLGGYNHARLGTVTVERGP